MNVAPRKQNATIWNDTRVNMTGDTEATTEVERIATTAMNKNMLLRRVDARRAVADTATGNAASTCVTNAKKLCN